MKKLLLLLVILPICTWGQIITTVAGNGMSNYNGDNILATSAGIGYVGFIQFDKYNNLFIASGSQNRIRKVSPSGIITTIAGTGVAGYSGDSSLAINANLNSPYGISIDSVGNIYITDANNARIRKILPSGNIVTIAGTGIAGYGGDSNLATLANFNSPTGLSFDNFGNIYISDAGNHRIRKINISTNIVSTISGTGISGYNGDNISSTVAKLNSPNHTVFDSIGNLFIADGANGRVRKIDAITGIITTIAGNGMIGYNGDSILAINASINGVADIAFNKAYDLFIADKSNNRIRKVNMSTGVITTVVGNGNAGYSGDNNSALSAQLYFPYGIIFDNCDNLYISDDQNKRIRKVWFNTDTLPQVNIGVTPNDTVITGSQITTTATANNHGTITSYQWVKNGANASTNSAYTYTPNNGDSVYCIVTVSACTGRMYTDTTNAIHITVTGGASIASTNATTTHTYPNPVTDVLHVTTVEPQHYVLHNLMGVAILQGSVDKQSGIDMKEIPAGVYLLQLTDSNGAREVQRIVKE